jgi:MFS family permease
MTMSDSPIILGLRVNWRQFTLLAVINAFVGAMVGLERTIVPLIAKAEFGIQSSLIVLSFLISFGVTKALTNLFAGRLSEHLGRKKILVAGWAVGLAVPILLIFAKSWGWVVVANILLGVNQGLCWSTTVIMKVDLVGPKRRGVATGVNEFAGYGAVALSTLMTGFLATTYGPYPVPFYPGVIFALTGLTLSLFFARETKEYAALEAQISSPHLADDPSRPKSEQPTFLQVFLLTSWKNRALFAASQAGLMKNLNDGVVWGLMPIFLAGKGLPIDQIGIVAALYPGVWGVSQLFTGPLSDRLGRKWMIAVGMWFQATGIGLFVGLQSFPGFLVAAVVLGLGAGLVYPTLLAAVSDVAHPEWRASALGVYRLWRDGGYAIGGLVSGILADALGIPFAMAAVAGLTFLSGMIVSVVMYETLPRRRMHAASSIDSNPTGDP